MCGAALAGGTFAGRKDLGWLVPVWLGEDIEECGAGASHAHVVAQDVAGRTGRGKGRGLAVPHCRRPSLLRVKTTVPRNVPLAPWGSANVGTTL